MRNTAQDTGLKRRDLTWHLVRDGPRFAAPMWRMVLAQARLELLLALRRGESVLVTLIVPVLLLVFFGSLPILPSLSTDRIDYLLPGIVALAVMSTAMVSLGIATAFERHYRVLKRLGATPLSRGGLLTAKIASVLALEALQIMLLVAVAALGFGWSGPLDLSLALISVALGTAAFAGIGLMMAGALRAELTLALANGLYLLFLMLGGIVLPTSLLPAPLGMLAELTPAAALADALRASVDVSGVWYVRPLVVLTFWAIAAPVAAARLFRWE